jgi:hypothetical protein
MQTLRDVMSAGDLAMSEGGLELPGEMPMQPEMMGNMPPEMAEMPPEMMEMPPEEPMV